MVLSTQTKNSEYILADDGTPTVAVRETTEDGGKIPAGAAHYVASHVVPTVADLANITPIDGRQHSTLGYTTAGDGGGATYRYSSGSSATVNAGSVIDGPGSVGRFLMTSSGVNVLQWGFIGDRVTDNSARLTALLTYLKTLTVRPEIYFPSGFYLFSTQAKFDIPAIKVRGDGMNASFLISDTTVLFNYPNPTLRDIGIATESTTAATVGLEFRNCWQGIIENVEVQNFSTTALLVSLTAQGEGLLPGNTEGGPYPNDQFGGGGIHSSWPNLDEFVRDGIAEGTTGHWGSRVTITTIVNFHCKTDGTGIHLNNTLADATADYDDFDSLLVAAGSNGLGVFYTGITIERGHLFCRDKGIHVSGGVHGVNITDTYIDMTQDGIRLDYGAQGIKITNTNIDSAGSFAANHEPRKAYIIDDKVRISDREYINVGAGDSAANEDYNGVPNSEFVGVPSQLAMLPVAGGSNNDIPHAGAELLTQGTPYGMDVLSVDVQVFIEGVEVINGQRWLNMATYLPVATGGSESANIFFGAGSLAMPVRNTDEVRAGFQFQHRDPLISQQPAVVGRIRGTDSNAAQTQTSTGDDLTVRVGFSTGEVVVVTDSMTVGATTVFAAPMLLVTYSSSQSGWFPFRISVPQINIGTSLGQYIRTNGQRRAGASDGPSGTGSAISDGGCTWDYSGDPVSAIIAPRQVWETSGNDVMPEIRYVGDRGTNQPAFENGILSHQYTMLPNPANSNLHTTALPE